MIGLRQIILGYSILSFRRPTGGIIYPTRYLPVWSAPFITSDRIDLFVRNDNQDSPMKTVILAGGMGTRLAEETDNPGFKHSVRGILTTKRGF